MDLTNVFGVDVETMFLNWFNNEFKREFEDQYPDSGISLIILDPDVTLQARAEWREPYKYKIIRCWLGEESAALAGAGGTLKNVENKLSFVLRTGENSVVAESRRDLVREGDFPWEGAGTFLGYTGGVSGLAKQDDWRVFCHCVRELSGLLNEIVSEAMFKAKTEREQYPDRWHLKYLNGINVADQF